MPRPPITTLSNLTCRPSATNSYNAIYIPQLTTAQITGIPAASLINGAIVYNINTDVFRVYQANMWVDLNPAAGYVIGPVNAVDGNIAIFDGTTGKVIRDSLVVIGRVPIAFSNLLETPLVDINELGNIGHIRFQYGTNDIGLIFVDSLMAVEFITNNYSGSNYQVCSLFTGGLPSSSTTPSALVELQSTTGTLLLSRLTTTQVSELTAPAAGMIAYNSTANQLINYTNGAWGSIYVSPGLTNHLVVQSTNADPTNTAGSIYYNTTINRLKAYNNNAWSWIYSSPYLGATPGVGLSAGYNPFTLPTGTKPEVETGPLYNGFMYYNATNSNIRCVIGAAWLTLYASPSLATGVGLTNGYIPFTLPTGTSSAVEVAANEVNGFMYYNATNSNIRCYNGVWGTNTIVSSGLTCGQATFVTSATGITISTTAVTTSSIVLITPSTGSATYTVNVGTFVVSNIVNNTSFSVILQVPVLQDFTINWLIINP